MEIATSHAMKFKWPYNRFVVYWKGVDSQRHSSGIPTYYPVLTQGFSLGVARCMAVAPTACYPAPLNVSMGASETRRTDRGNYEEWHCSKTRSRKNSSNHDI